MFLEIRDVSERIKGSDIRRIAEYDYHIPSQPLSLKEGPDDDIDITGDTPPDGPDGASRPAGGQDMGGGNKVEIDVTGIVQKQDEMMSKMEQMSQSLIQSIQGMDSKFQSIEQKFQTSEQNQNKSVIELKDEMEKEFKKRIPTPNEKILMQSLSSFPYNVKLTDYFKPVRGDEHTAKLQNARPESQNGDNYWEKVYQSSEQKPAEYVITNKDVEERYNSVDIQNSF